MQCRWLVFILEWMEHNGLNSCGGVKWYLEVFWQVTNVVASCSHMLLYISFLGLIGCVLIMWLNCKCPLRVASANFSQMTIHVLCFQSYSIVYVCIFSYGSLSPCIEEGRMSFIHLWWTIKIKLRSLMELVLMTWSIRPEKLGWHGASNPPNPSVSQFMS